MHQNRSIFALIIVLFIGTNCLAQKIKTAKDTAFFIDCTQMPAAAPQYTLSFGGSALDLEYEIEEQEDKKESIEVLLQKLEDDPTDVSTALLIAAHYQEVIDEKNYRTYMEYAFNHAKKKYLEHPDSFDITAQFVSILQKVQNMEGVLAVWNEFVMAQPKEVRGLTQFAIQLAIQGQLEKARHFTKQAYEIAPQNPEVYIAAMMCEFTNVILQLSEVIEMKGDDAAQQAAIDNIRIDNTFFDTAIKDSGVPAAQMAKDAAQMLVIFYRTILAAVEQGKDIGEEKISISPNASDAKIIKGMEKRYKKQLKSKAKNLYFAYKVLTTIEIIKGNESKAVDYWKKSDKFLAKDADILRLLSFAHFLDLDFANAILYLEKKLAAQSDYDDFYALGRFYVYQGQLAKAYEVFGATMQLNPADRRAICARISILLRQNKFEEAAALMDDFPSTETDDINAYHLNYFKAVLTLARGEEADAFKRLKSIPVDSDYKEDADKLLAYFFKK